MKKCPFCAEEIQDEASKCRFCGELLNDTNNEKNIEEVIIYKGKVNWSYYIMPIIFIITIWLSPIGLYFIIYHNNKKIELTNKKFTYTHGIFSKKQLDIKLNKIESIAVKKNLIDMMFGSGTVIISGTGGNNEPVVGIDKPDELKKAVESEINKKG